MKPWFALLATVALTVAGAAEAGLSGTELVVPSVGKGPGSAGSQWRTTLWIHNPGATSAVVELAFLKRGSENPAPSTTTLTVKPGATERFGDAMDSLFGIGKGYGALLVRATTEVVVNARIFSQTGSDEAQSVGQFFTAVPTEAAIGSGESTTVLGVFQLSPASRSPFRYNFGFVEVSGAAVRVEASVLNGKGTVLGSKTYELGAFGVDQRAVDDLLPSISSDNLRLRLQVVSGSGRIVAFGSGIANGSNDPSTFEMSIDRGKLGGASATGGLRSRAGAAVDIITVFPAFTTVTTVRIPAGEHLVMARLNLKTMAVSHGVLGGPTLDAVICRLRGTGAIEDTALFNSESHGQVFDEAFDMAGTMLTTVSSSQARELTLACALFDDAIVTYGGWVRVSPWGVYAIELASIGTLEVVQ